MRYLLGVLREDGDGGELAPQPGLAQLEDLLARVRGAGVAVRLDVSGTPRSLAPGLDLSAYRIVQEALTNAAKHAPGARVDITVERPAGQLVVRVVNGPGRAAEPGFGGGYGLVGLAERVRTLGGRLTAEPRLDGGFLVEAVLPA